MKKLICEDCPVRQNCEVVSYDVECDKKRADYYLRYTVDNKSSITTGTPLYETEIIGYNDEKY